ncbi:MAG: segregation ATPase FtsK/SpoIIIE, family, partial [Thermoleophilaceae bacterium]|nr:segregation ATPase FtsK/SpoIIIE, family [Thermoleophilaceae bacterium]
MASRRTPTKSRRPAKKRAKKRRSRSQLPQISLRIPRMPELEQRHLDVIGLGLVALAAFFAFVFYLGWDGGKVGGAFADAFRFLLGGVAYLMPVVLLATGTVLVLRPMLPSVKPFKAGGVCLILALMLGLAGGLFGLGPDDPARHGFMHAGYFRHHGGVFGEAAYWIAKTLVQRFGAYIVFVFLLTAGVMLLTGASVAGVVRGTRAGVASTTRRVRQSTSEFAALVTGRSPREHAPPDPAERYERPRARAPEVEPLVRATHVEAPALDGRADDDPADDQPEPQAVPNARAEPPRAPFPRAERAAAEVEAGLTPQGNRRSEVTEADDVDYKLPKPSLLTRSKSGAKVDTAAQERTA